MRARINSNLIMSSLVTIMFIWLRLEAEGSW